MPEETALAAPAQAPAAATAPAAPAATPTPGNAQQTSATATDSASVPKPEPKPFNEAKVSPKARALESLRSKANLDDTGAVIPPDPAKPATTDPAKAAAPSATVDPAAKPGEQTAPATEAAAAAKDDDKSLGPWQQKAKWEKEAKSREQEVLKLRKTLSDLGNVEEVKQRAEQLDARVKELEAEIKYVDFSKSEEFKAQFQKPYEQAWTKAMADLKEIQVAGENGNIRAADVNDLLQLVNLPLGEALTVASEKFGLAANEVMAHRRTVRELAAKQQEALDNAKKLGVDRDRQHQEAGAEITRSTQTAWQQFIKEDEEKVEFLRHKEGDDEWNEKLSQARELVDRALSGKAMDTRLTPEQRMQLVRDQASLRGRAIAFSGLKLQVARMEQALAAKDAEIAKFKNAEPPAGQGAPSAASAAGSSNAMERAHATLRRKATLTA